MLTLLLMTSAWAGDVLVPAFTPKTTSDFSIAESLTEATLVAMTETDVDFVTPAEIESTAGDVAIGCADEPDCVPTLWREFDTSRLLVLGSVTHDDGQVSVQVRYYGADDSSPIEVLATSFAEADAAGFAEQVAFFASELIPLMPARTPTVEAPPPPPEEPLDDGLTDEEETEASDQDAPLERLPPDDETAPHTDSSLPTPPVQAPPPPRDEPDPEDERARHAAGLPLVAWQKYRDSGMNLADWKESAMVRSGKVTIEANGGFAFGDVDRRYDTRVRVDQQIDDTMVQSHTYQYETFTVGQTFVVGGTLGWHPAWWIELGVGGGVQLSEKVLTTGWEQYKDDALVDSNEEIYPAVSAQMGTVEPRLRLHFSATGVIKPYALINGLVRIYDGYTVPDLTDVDYPDRESGVSFAVGGGAGLIFDMPEGAYGFIEVPWDAVLAPKPVDLGQPDSFEQLPDQVVPSGQLLVFRAGLGVRM